MSRIGQFSMLLGMLLVGMAYVVSPGPRGPAGVAGANGSNGANGTNGTNGTNGSPGGMGPVLFGDKSDGTGLTFDGSTTILGVTPVANTYTFARNLFLDSATINAGVKVNLPSGRLFARTLVNNGTIHSSGGAGGNATGTPPGPYTQGAAGVAGGPVGSAIFYGQSGTGANGTTGGVQTGGQNTGPSWPGTTVGTVVGTTGAGSTGGVCQGGAGGGSAGSGGTGIGGGGGTTAATTPTGAGTPHEFYARFAGRASWAALSNNGQTAPWSAASGGGSGRVIVHFARSACGGGGGGAGIIGVFVQNYSGTGTIESKGGAAGTGLLDSLDGAGGETPVICGSAGGGGGIAVVVVGPGSTTPTVSVAGGAGAAAVAGTTAFGATAGGSGGAGISYVDVLS